MSNLVNADNISKAFGEQLLLDGISLGIAAGDRIGVVGRNGGGKSTLARILAGYEQPDSGRVSRVGGLTLAMVGQDGELSGDTVLAAVVGDRAEHDWASDPRIRTIFDGLGLRPELWERGTDELSGGQRRRVALAAALIEEPDLLILDEPTNHLDVEGAQWLAEYLLRRRGALLVVTHDRWFLDTVVTTTWEVHDGRVDSYLGGYNDWIFARAERSRLADAAEERRRNLARKELAWLRRGPPARTSKPRYRIDAAEKLIADVPPPRDSVALTAFAKRRLGREVIELEGAQIATPAGEVLLDDLTWRLAPGERIGLVGVNGSGKTSLLTALGSGAGIVAGRRKQGQTVSIGWLRQEIDDLPAADTVIGSLQAIADFVTVGDKEISASQLAERLGFTPKRQRAVIGELSGGERRRLALTRVLLAEPNVLLLDEPTNDLDIDTLQQLEDLLDTWAGTLVLISHDRFLIERLCDSTWALFGDGGLTNLPGGIEQYLQQRAQQRSDRPAGSAPAGGAGAVATTKPAGSAAAEREARKSMQRLERQIEKLTTTREELHEQLAAAATDAAALQRLTAELADVSTTLEDAESQWLELAGEWG